MVKNIQKTDTSLLTGLLKFHANKKDIAHNEFK